MNHNLTPSNIKQVWNFLISNGLSIPSLASSHLDKSMTMREASVKLAIYS